MTAICKTIPIHGTTTSPLLKYCENNNKTSISKNIDTLQGLIDYGSDPLKAICDIDEDHKELLITGIKCSPETAAEEFALTKEKYLALKGTTEEFDKNYDPSKGYAKRQPMLAVHMIQSFAETNIDPRVAHEIGVRLAESFGSQAVVDTHMNREHIHNHIIINSYKDNGRKVHVDKEFILSARELSDELQKEFGIPIEFENPRDQLRHKQRGTLTRKEWEHSQAGTSWKDQMREDISTISEIAKSREDYLQLMEAYGYQIVRDTPNSITFYCEKEGRKIRDKTLGNDYMVGELYPPYADKNINFRINDTYKRVQTTPVMGKPISIARYDANGRRRSLIEMLIRKAIAIIQRIGNFFFDERQHSKNNDYYSPKNKIEMLNVAIDTVKKYDIQGQGDLDRQTETAGASLSHAKRNLQIAEIEKQLVETVDTALTDIEMLSMLKTTVGELHLHEYSKDEVLKNKAKIAPMTSKQKKDLSRQLAQNDDMRLMCRFDEISCSDAEKILNYFNGKSEKRPEMLLTKEEFKHQNIAKQMDAIYERQLDRLKDKHTYSPVSEASLRQVEKILEKKGISLDISTLTQYDVISIKNSFGDNPFESPLISAPQKKLLEDKIEELGIKINRKPEFITTLEFNHFMRFVEKKTKAVPSFIGEHEQPSDADIQRLNAFMKVKGIKSSVPVHELSKQDFNKLYSHVICAGHIPEILEPIDRETNSEKDNMFYARVGEYNVSRSLHLAQLRNAYNTLRSLGFDVKVGDDLSHIREQVNMWNEAYDKIVNEKEDFATKYSELIKLKQTVKLAKDPSFLYGELFNPKVDKEIVVEERDEKDTRSEEEDKKYRRQERDDEPSL